MQMEKYFKHEEDYLPKSIAIIMDGDGEILKSFLWKPGSIKGFWLATLLQFNPL